MSESLYTSPSLVPATSLRKIRSPKPMFWVFGPSILIAVSMFVANPQCILDAHFSCSQNWSLSGETLSVWTLKQEWLDLARLSAASCLLLIWLGLLYHLYLAITRKTPRTKFVYMGGAVALLVPPAIYLVIHQIRFSSNIVQSAATVHSTDGGSYRLFTQTKKNGVRYFLSTDLIEKKWFLQSHLLGTVLLPNKPRYSLLFMPKLAVMQQKDYPVTLYLAGDNYILVVDSAHLILAYDIRRNKMIEGAGLAEISPLLLTLRKRGIAPSQFKRFTEQIKALTKMSGKQRFVPPSIETLKREMTSELSGQVRLLFSGLIELLYPHAKASTPSLPIGDKHLLDMDYNSLRKLLKATPAAKLTGQKNKVSIR